MHAKQEGVHIWGVLACAGHNRTLQYSVMGIFLLAFGALSQPQHVQSGIACCCLP